MRSLISIWRGSATHTLTEPIAQSFAESPNIGRLSSMYMYAWKNGLKTTYYLRSRPATRIAKPPLQLCPPLLLLLFPDVRTPAPARPAINPRSAKTTGEKNKKIDPALPYAPAHALSRLLRDVSRWN